MVNENPTSHEKHRKNLLPETQIQFKIVQTSDDIYSVNIFRVAEHESIPTTA